MGSRQISHHLLFVTSAVMLLAAVSWAASPQQASPVQPENRAASAKKIFISNLITVVPPIRTGAGQLRGPMVQPYDAVYAAMKNWGRYEVVLTPGEADLVLETEYKTDCRTRQVVIHERSFLGEHDATIPQSEVQTICVPHVTLRAFDAQNHSALWSSEITIHESRLYGGTVDQSFRQTILVLLNQFARFAGSKTTVAVPKEITSAPLPSQLFTARKVFWTIDPPPGGMKADEVYGEIIKTMKDWKHFQFVDQATDAELQFELTPEARLLIRDTKTRALLWTIAQPVRSALLQSNRKKNLKASMHGIAGSLQGLVRSTGSNPGGRMVMAEARQ